MKRKETSNPETAESNSHISLHKYSNEKTPSIHQSICQSQKAEESSKDPRLAGTLLPDQIHFISLAVVDFEFGEGR